MTSTPPESGAESSGSPDVGGPPPEATAPPYSAQPYSAQPTPMQAYPAGADEPPPADVPQPQSIVLAVRLMWAGAALSLFGLIVGLISLSSIKDKIADQLRDNNDYSQANLDNAYHIAIVSTIVVSLIATALWLWMAYANGRGRSWARIVATVLGGLNILFFVGSLAQNQETSFLLVLSVIDVLVAAVIIVLLWRGESTEYYRTNSRRV